MDPVTLRNRLLVATGMWREVTGEVAAETVARARPSSRCSSSSCCSWSGCGSRATAENAREIADRTWDLVHDRPEGDPVRRRVVECHEALARISRLGD